MNGIFYNTDNRSKMSNTLARFILTLPIRLCHGIKLQLSLRIRPSKSMNIRIFIGSGRSRISGGGGGVDSRSSYVSKNLDVEMNESGPLGGVRRAGPPLDPSMIGMKLWTQIYMCKMEENIFHINEKLFLSPYTTFIGPTIQVFRNEILLAWLERSDPYF